MAISVSTLLTQRVIARNADPGGSGDFTSSTFTTVSTSLVVALIAWDLQSNPSNFSGAIPTPTTTGLTWVRKGSIYSTRTYTTCAEIWMADVTTGASGLTFAMSGSGDFDTPVAVCDIYILSVTGAGPASAQPGVNAGAQSPSDSGRDPGAYSLTLSGTSLSTSCVVGITAADVGGLAGVVAGTSWTEVARFPAITNYMSSQVQYRIAAVSAIPWNDLNDAGSSDLYDFCALGLEIKEPSTGANGVLGATGPTGTSDIAGRSTDHYGVLGATGPTGTSGIAGTNSTPGTARSGVLNVTGPTGTTAIAGISTTRNGVLPVTGPTGTSTFTGNNTPPPTLYADDFNRANTTVATGGLGSNWTTTGGFFINTNQCFTTVNAGAFWAGWNNALTGTDQFVQATIASSMTGAGDFRVISLRMPSAASTTDGYWAMASGLAGNLEIGKTVAGVDTTLLSGASGAISGSVLRLEVVGNTLTLKHNGVAVLGPVTDLSLTTGLYSGFNASVAGASNLALFDDWSTGTVVTTATGVLNATGPTGSSLISGTATAPVGPRTGTLNTTGPTATSVIIGIGGVVAPAFASRISGRRIVDQYGRGFLLPTMSSWGMAQVLTNTEITTALQGLADRHFKGATIDYSGGISMGSGAGWHQYRNAAGNPYYATVAGGTTIGTPFVSPLGAAWSSVDWCVQETQRLGLTISLSLFLSLWGSGAWGAFAGLTSAQARTFGQRLANRYLAYDHIVWHVMFDADPGLAVEVKATVEAMFQGINETEGASRRPVRWAEPGGGTVSTYATVISQGWTNFNVTLNGFYSYANTSADLVNTSYNEAGATTYPTGDVEPPYDGAPHYGAGYPQQLRERNYSVFIGGGVYINYGHEDWWRYGLEGAGFTEGLTWPEVPTHVHTRHAQYCWDFIDIYCKELSWVGDTTGNQFLVSGVGSGDDRGIGGHSANYAAAYFPSNSRTTVTVDTTVLAGTGPVKLQWFDPVLNAYTLVAASEAQNSARIVTYPAVHFDSTSDWVLVAELVTPITGASGTLNVTGPTGSTNINGTFSSPARTGLLNVTGPTATTLIAGTYTGVGSKNGILAVVGPTGTSDITGSNLAPRQGVLQTIGPTGTSLILGSGGLGLALQVYLGTGQVTKVYLGTQEVSAVYLGDTRL